MDLHQIEYQLTQLNRNLKEIANELGRIRRGM